MNIDYDRLRNDLIDYFGSAMSIFPQAVLDIDRIERASEYELEIIARQNGFDLSNYEQHTYTKHF